MKSDKLKCKNKQFKITFAHFLFSFQVRDEEMVELDHHHRESCSLVVDGGAENSHGKANILLQTYISKSSVDNFSLVSDMAYVAQVKYNSFTTGNMMIEYG